MTLAADGLDLSRDVRPADFVLRAAQPVDRSGDVRQPVHDRPVGRIDARRANADQHLVVADARACRCPAARRRRPSRTCPGPWPSSVSSFRCTSLRTVYASCVRRTLVCTVYAVKAQGSGDLNGEGQGVTVATNAMPGAEPRNRLSRARVLRRRDRPGRCRRAGRPQHAQARRGARVSRRWRSTAMSPAGTTSSTA